MTASLIPYEVCALDTVRKIDGPLRMAKKYEMDELFHRLVVVLRRDWPSDFATWQANQELMYERFGDRLKDQDQPVTSLQYSSFFPDPGSPFVPLFEMHG